MRFYLGTHHPHWLSRLDVPLFVSHRTLAHRRTLPRARVGWALDSGAFTELSTYGAWRTTPQTYAAAVARYAAEIGRLDWAAPQDWMCEPFMLERTGLTVAEHQRRTIASYLTLRDLAPTLPWVPVLQGWALNDYLAHLDAYAAAGVDLAAVPVVGLGSVCRRQATREIDQIVATLAETGLRLHGFGVKTAGLVLYGPDLTSADSLAWSYQARRRPPLPGCVRHRTCANCPRYALAWRERVLRRADQPAPRQLALALNAHNNAYVDPPRTDGP